MEYTNLLMNLLYQMAYADGKFNEQEKQFIAQVIEETNFAIDEENINQVAIPSEEKDRMTILYYLLFLVKIDGVVDEREKLFAQKFGLLLGFREDMIVEMLDLMVQHLENQLPDDELVMIIKKYMN